MAGEHDQDVQEGTEVLYDIEQVITHEQYLQVGDNIKQCNTIVIQHIVKLCVKTRMNDLCILKNCLDH